jgi:predicted permease
VTWREARRISDVAFTEVCLQAIFAYRQGNSPLAAQPGRAARLARRRVVQSKLLVGAVLGLVALGGAAVLAQAPRIAERAFFGVVVTVPVLQAGVLTGILSLEVAFLWWTGLQVLPTFLASGALSVLEPLPIDDRTLGRAAGILYLRLFDVPALVVLIATPLCVGLALGPVAGLVVVPGVVCAVAFALGLALVTGRAFVRRVQGSRGGGGRSVVRWAYLVLWVLPAFALFGFSVAAPGFLALLGTTIAAGPSPARDVLLAAYPFTFAALPPIALGGPSSLALDGTGVAILFAAAAGYLLLAEWSVAWMMRSVRRIGLAPATTSVPEPVAPRPLVPRGAARAILTKDLRIASRTPGYAFLVIFPILDAVAIGLFTFISGPGTNGALALALAAVTTAALLATFFGPAFFAIEVNAYAYGRTLPITDRSIILGKVALVAGIYAVAAGLVLGITLLRVYQPVVFLAFIAAVFPAVVAAAMLELGILFRRSRARGLPLTNLYAGAWYAIVVSIPGLIVAGLPLIVFHLLAAQPIATALTAMGAVALAELAIAAPFAVGIGRGRTP